MKSTEIIALTDENIMGTYARFPVAIDRGEGSTLYSPEGKKYIDLTSGIGVNSLGYGDEAWVGAIAEQAGKLQHISNLYYTEPAARLAWELTDRTGLDAVFFSNSGAEANEGAIKLARKYSFDKYGSNRSTIVTLKQSFHGRTVTTLSATGQDRLHKFFYPFTEGFKYTPANDLTAFKDACNEGVCAVMMELIQGEGGVLPLNRDFVTGAAKYCAAHDILLIIDEVQTGIGRTGSLFAFQQYGISPDVVTFAKGIAGGLPFGGFLASRKCSRVLGAGTHAATFGANPICAAAANEVISRMTPELMRGVHDKGAHIRKTVASWKLDCVKEVRGMGLMNGIAVKGAAPRDVALGCMDRGALVLTAGSDTVRLLPPLTISYEELDEGLDIIKTVLEEI